MSKASLYRWFPSKTDLTLAVLDRRDENFWSTWDRIARRSYRPGRGTPRASRLDSRSSNQCQLPWMRVRQHRCRVRQRFLSGNPTTLLKPRRGTSKAAADLDEPSPRGRTHWPINSTWS
ncbi:TetR/AcrR family transcriptional regulator [Gordonia polyisoprenivorans]|uniref:TetR/AcrR family transcriptional regulator n=1 Tax=Gordonia polyisoprenivorans TaxID=84595 RepID=UPI001B8D5C77|nr:TetR/AcrR family transcriptional regulator [Gordonia polyisoprenivorans]